MSRQDAASLGAESKWRSKIGYENSFCFSLTREFIEGRRESNGSEQFQLQLISFVDKSAALQTTH
uniref:Uncharacterized protein n=1 Tax=Daphnia magna TaxID=35525 RepID=A0A0N8EJ51_9CRUS